MDGIEIGRFTLIERIGSGATSVVYQAVERETGRSVAIKLLARALAFNAYARAQLLSEIERLTALNHPQIVPILQTGMHREQVYLVLPHYPAGSLAERMAHRWTLAETRTLIEQLAAPLAIAHAAGVVHGRIKPSNILFDANGSPCLVDFGLAQLSLANSGGWRGNALHVTPYTAPEQRDGRQLTPQADIYALGMLAQRLTGRDDIALSALAPVESQRPETVGALAETIIEPINLSWRQRIATRVASYLQ